MRWLDTLGVHRTTSRVPARGSAPLAGALLAACVGLLAWVGLLGEPARAADMSWIDDDWSAGNHEATVTVDPDVHPGLLILSQRLDDIRYFASPVDFQGLYAMAVLHDTLWIASSDYPYMYDGAKVLCYDYRSGEFAVAYEPYESGCHIIKRFGDSLYVPGPDTMDPWGTPGSIYIYTGSAWIEKATIPEAVHVNDVEVVDGLVYVTAGHWNRDLNGCGGAWISYDGGDSFEQVLNLPPTAEHYARRIFGAGSIGDRVFVQPDGFPPQSSVVYSTTNGVDWDTLAVPNMPVDKHAMFTAWGDSLLMTMHNRMYIWNGEQWLGRWLPFEGYRWCRGIHKYKGRLYGGGSDLRLYRWIRDNQWEVVGELGLNPGSEEIEAMATYYGRLFISTSRTDYTQMGALYVSAAEPFGALVSRVHDFGNATTNGFFSWVGFLNRPENAIRFQLRSAPTVEELQESLFVGPDGAAGTYYTDPLTQLPALHSGHRYFQYRVEMTCDQGLSMPYLDRVTLEVDSLDASAVLDPAAATRSSRAPVAGLLLELAEVRPNPAQGAVQVEVVARVGAEGAAAALPTRTPVELQVLDVEGRVIRRGRVIASAGGDVRWPWDLRDAHGERVGAGVYQIRASTPGPAPAAVRTIVVLP